MIYGSLFAIADTNPVTATMDVSFGLPMRILASVNMTGLSMLEAAGTSFAGFMQLTQVDPATGVRTTVDTRLGFFGCAPIVTADNADSVTLVIASSSEVPAVVEAAVLIFNLAPDGTLLS